MDFLTQDAKEIALSLMEGLDSAVSLSTAILLRHGEWDQIVRKEVVPSHYCSPEVYFRDRQAACFLAKLDVDAGPDLEPATFEKWLWAEKQCFNTNRRLDRYIDFGPHYGPDCEPWLVKFLDQFRENVRWLIGDGPPSTFDGKFGPGATVSDASRYTTVCHKMSSRPTFTPDALFHLIPWTGTKWAAAYAADSGESPLAVRGNTYFSVPKSSVIRRSCGKEPSINGFYQLGLGRVMRERLKKRGIDLDNGQDVHRQVACANSRKWGYSGSATLDLTSASDCICTNLVKLVFPPRWYDALFALRSPMTEVNKTWYRLEKFSSMGNGYTFELETVIFTALSLTCMDIPLIGGTGLYVYGDDMIVPSSDVKTIVSALKYFGLVVNEKKSFVEGSFRESCGGDFFDGVAVRPYYLKELFNEPQQIIALANGVRRMALQNSHDRALFARIRRTWFRILDLLPSHIRCCRGPEALGDLVIHDDESRWSVRWRGSGIRYLKCYRPAKYSGTGFERFSPGVQLASALYGVALRQIRHTTRKPREGEDFRSVIGRDSVLGYKVGWVPFS